LHRATFTQPPWSSVAERPSSAGGAGWKEVMPRRAVLPAPPAATPGQPAPTPRKKCINRPRATSKKGEGGHRSCKGKGMATGQTSEVIQHLRRVILPRIGAGLTDGQLLEDYLSRRDEAALAALVRRHGPMVWGACRRVLPDHHDAEDA